MSLGAKLKKLRIAKGKSLQEVAAAVGASKTHVWDLETGRSQNPSMDLLSRLADYFEIPVSDLIGENPSAKGEDPKLVAMYRGLKELNEDDRQTVKMLMERLRATKRESNG